MIFKTTLHNLNILIKCYFYVSFISLLLFYCFHLPFLEKRPFVEEVFFALAVVDGS